MTHHAIGPYVDHEYPQLDHEYSQHTYRMDCSCGWWVRFSGEAAQKQVWPAFADHIFQSCIGDALVAVTERLAIKYVL